MCGTTLKLGIHSLERIITVIRRDIKKFEDPPSSILDCCPTMAVKSVFRRARLMPKSRISILLRSRYIVYPLYLVKQRHYSVTTQLIGCVKANLKRLRQNKEALC